MKKAIRDEMSLSENKNSPKNESNLEKRDTNVDMSKYAADGVYFRCPLLGLCQVCTFSILIILFYFKMITNTYCNFLIFRS